MVFWSTWILNNVIYVTFTYTTKTAKLFCPIQTCRMYCAFCTGVLACAQVFMAPENR